MATRKRVRAFRHAPHPRRAPDGSAFMKCEECGVSVAVALMDMHECNLKKDVKKFKGNSKPSIPKINCISDQPRSPFMFFMQSYSKSRKGSRTLVEISQEAVEKWKIMSSKERRPFILMAQKVENAYLKVLHQEEIQLSQEKDDEAESSKCTKYNDYENSDDYCSDEEDFSEDCSDEESKDLKNYLYELREWGLKMSFVK